MTDQTRPNVPKLMTNGGLVMQIESAVDTEAGSRFIKFSLPDIESSVRVDLPWDRELNDDEWDATLFMFENLPNLLESAIKQMADGSWAHGEGCTCDED